MRLLLLLTFITAAAPGAIPVGPAQPPLYSFEENRGQVHPDVRYTTRGRGYQLYLTPRGAVLSLHTRGKPDSVLRMQPQGGSAATLEALDPLPNRSHYLVGAPGQWCQDIPNWGRIRYRGVYPGIDLVYYGRDGQLEYDFVAAPGSSPEHIEISLNGAQSLAITDRGDLQIRLAGDAGYLTQKAPVAYQTVAGRRQAVAASYRINAHGRIGFRLGAYDRSLPLVIDPVMVYSTYLGGDHTDEVTSIAVDRDGNTYLAGETTSGDYPSVNPLLPKPNASVHAFVTKINAAGDRILYSTYLGGDGNTRANAIAVDADGNVFVAGRTGARNFPVKNPVQDRIAGLNIVFLTKINAQGSNLMFSTYLGGERNDEAYGVALDAAGDVFVAGIANSAQFPTVNALYAKAPGGGESFVAKFAAPDYRLAYSTYFGGTSNDEIHALAVDPAGNAYVTGLTTSTGMGTKDAFQPQLKSQDAFVARLNSDGTALDFFTYLGGTGYERGRAIQVAADGSIWVGGYTTSANFPVSTNAFQPALNGDSDAFLSRLSADGRQLLYSTFLGGKTNAGIGGEDLAAIALDSDQSIFAVGVTMSADFPSVRAIQAFGGGKQDAFLVKFAPEGDRVIFSTLLGGSGDEIAEALTVDAQGGIYVAGQTASANYPVKGGVSAKMTGTNEGFLTKVCDPFLWASQAPLTFVQVVGRPAPEAQNFQLVTCLDIPFTAAVAEGRFLKVSARDTKTNSQVDVSVDPGSFTVGEYQDSIRISAPDAVNDSLTIPVTLIVKLPPPVISADAVLDASTGDAGPLTPGMVLEIHGSDLGPKTPVELADGDIALAGTTVTFDDVPAKVILASDAVVRVVVPDSILGRNETVVAVQFQGQSSNAIKLPVAQPPANQ